MEVFSVPTCSNCGQVFYNCICLGNTQDIIDHVRECKEDACQIRLKLNLE